VGVIGFGVFEGDGVNEYVGGLKLGLIGFVLHKNELIYRVFSTDVEDRGQLTEDSCEVPNASCQLTEIHSS
jgi:hypothetical protein